MKRIILLIALLIPSLALAENLQRNESQAVLYAAEGAVGPIKSADRFGNQMCSLSAGTTTNTNPIRLEDSLTGSGHSGIVTLHVLQTALEANATNNDYAVPKIDAMGRTITTLAPANEMFSSCSAAVTTTSRTAIKTAVASNRHYTTSITCKNSSTVPSGITFTDGAGAAFGVGSVAAVAVGGGFAASFPVPARGTVNTDISMTMDVTSTSTICCAQGYVATN